MEIIKKSEAGAGGKKKRPMAASETNLATFASAASDQRSASWASSSSSSSSSAAPSSLSASGGNGGSSNGSGDGVAKQAGANGASKLVFGLSSRTNRSKHDEYAERRARRQPQSQPQQQQQPPLQQPTKQTTTSAGAHRANQPIEIDFRRTSGASMSSGTRQPAAQAKPEVPGASSKARSQSSESRARRTSSGSSGGSGNGNSETREKSKKSTQLDLNSSNSSSGKAPSLRSSAGAGGGEMAKMDQQADISAATATPAAAAAKSVASKPDKRPSASSGKSASKTTSVRARARSPDERTRLGGVGRRNSLEEDLSTMKIEPNRHALAREAGEEAQQQQQQQQQHQVVDRRQFNVTPPPQMSISTGKSGSVVGFAKARIYEKPAKPILPSNALLHQPSPLDPISSSPWCSPALDDRGHIPKSISSGLRPPKQVMVSKARKEWEGGEPFTKCKSRKRLAAQANKKLFPGTWSMTSVVATQQLHLQQALAQASSASRRSNIQETDPSVKVLTRGSVLERIQQYERVPSSNSTSGDSSPGSISTSSSSSSSSSSTSSGLDDQDDELIDATAVATAVNDLSRSPSASVSEAAALTTSGVGKKAHYKSRVSSIQNQQQQQQINNQLTSVNADPLQQQQQHQSGALAKSSSTSTVVQQRRFNLRRRSSILASSNNSTGSLIPKFYHPNGKPNTYEIELQKRQIVACFENFPDRSAQLEGPNARKHFHQISLACNFSEYFKVPLILYVKHKLETCPHLFATISANLNGALKQRKTSTVSLNTNGSSPQLTSLRRHSRSNSVVLNQPIKSLQKAASIESSAPQVDIALVSCDHFLACWRDLISRSYDNAARFVNLLTLGQRNYLLPEDFVPLVQSIIDDHPGLKFLRAAPDFHMRYIQTVIARIYFCINRSWTGKINLQELRKSNLLAVLQVLSQEDDINQITDYFSYEHFYVIYCKFWNLDQDHDLLISKEDLARHNDAAISSRIIERIFSNVVSKQIQKSGKMSYSDFVWFLIAEEDKKHPRSIEYWFRLMDLDGDGYISMYEMEYFYYEQMKRLELMNIEPLPFLDSACQILDLVNPREKNKISLADLKRTKMATIFFDTFINLEKYLEHESREFVSTRDVVQDGVVVSDWDRYAAEEYESLVVEETTV